MNPQESNPNDYKVVSFHNSTNFGFTPDMGCMYDGRPINGKTGFSGIASGETVQLPFHVGHRLATNLAKVSMTREAPSVDQAGVPTGVPLWDEDKLETLKNSFLTELYTEEKPATMSETDKLMAKVEEYKAMVDKLIPQAPAVEGYQDKAEVIAELEARGIIHDKRKNKDELEKLLA